MSRLPEPFANTQGVIPTITITGINGCCRLRSLQRAKPELGRGSTALTWVKGRHTLKFGVAIDRYNKSENAANQEGSFSFTSAGVPTGTSAYNQAWANFLLGNVAIFTMPSTDITPEHLAVADGSVCPGRFQDQRRA